MNHFLSTAALIGTVTLITTAPIKGEASTTPSHITHELLELKRKNEENTRKINQLEHRLTMQIPERICGKTLIIGLNGICTFLKPIAQFN
jgi:hypothetical protein